MLGWKLEELCRKILEIQIVRFQFLPKRLDHKPTMVGSEPLSTLLWEFDCFSFCKKTLWLIITPVSKLSSNSTIIKYDRRIFWMIWPKSRLAIVKNLILWNNCICLITNYPLIHLRIDRRYNYLVNYVADR